MLPRLQHFEFHVERKQSFGFEIVPIVLPNPRLNETEYVLIFQILLFDIHTDSNQRVCAYLGVRGVAFSRVESIICLLSSFC